MHRKRIRRRRLVLGLPWVPNVRLAIAPGLIQGAPI